MLCKNCERNIKSDFKYCPYCGERIISDYHDHYADLTPPPILMPDDEPDVAATYYAPAPGEHRPRFVPQEEAFELPDFGEDTDDLPDFGQPPEREEPASPPPYFVYDPDGEEAASPPEQGVRETPTFQIPRIEDADELPRGPLYSPPPAPVVTGPRMTTKLLAIVFSLLGGVATGVLFYQLLDFLR